MTPARGSGRREAHPPCTCSAERAGVNVAAWRHQWEGPQTPIGLPRPYGRGAHLLRCGCSVAVVNSRAMLIVRFMDHAGRVGWGQLLDGQKALPLHGELFGRHEFGRRPVDVVKRLSPVDPPNVFAIGLNYRGHAEEQGLRTLPDHPLIFLKATTSVTGPGAPIVLPESAPDEVDYEAELAVIIGTSCRRVSEADAAKYIFGFSCANDVSARDCQKRIDKQWARGKSFDTFCPLGPAIATPDAFDPSAVRIRATVNDEVMQDASTADLIFSVPALVSYLSHQFTLVPGTVILTGTPAGVGFTRNPPRYLRDGDVVIVEIDGIGRLSNPVVREPA